MNPLDSPTYCKLSHVSLAVQNEGDVCVCNKNTQSFEDGKKNKLYLQNDGLERMWRSPTRRLIQAALDYGKRIPSCQACWNDEDASIESLRQSYNEKLKDLNSIPTQPQILIIKPTNICNMGCRTCQPNTSTTLYQDFFKLDQELKNYTGTFKEYTSQFESIRVGLGKQNLDVWDTFEKWIPNLTVIDIYGGEPMLAPAMWDRIIAVAEQGQSAETTLQYHTNGTLWNQKYIDVLLKYKEARIGISIDSNDPLQLAYIRDRIDIESVFKNLEKYIELDKTNPTVTVNISFTVSVFNIWYADTIVDELSKFGIPVAINVVYGPDQYDMRHLPAEIKQTLIKRLSKNPQCDKLVSLLHHNIPGCDVWWPRFWKEVAILDRIRNQSFADTFPEYYQALMPYIPNV